MPGVQIDSRDQGGAGLADGDGPPRWWTSSLHPAPVMSPPPPAAAPPS